MLRDHSWVVPHWTNNNAESINHILKVKAGWRQLPVNTVIDNVHDIVRVQTLDLRAALTGRGNFALASAFGRHTVPYHVWATATEERKAALFSRYLRDTGYRCQPRVVTSKNGALTLPATAKVAKKPGQRSRSRAARTRTVCTTKR